jgi:hypothetical protein
VNVRLVPLAAIDPGVIGGLPFQDTLESAPNPLPDMAITVPPASGPWLGDIALTTGVLAAAATPPPATARADSVANIPTQ